MSPGLSEPPRATASAGPRRRFKDEVQAQAAQAAAAAAQAARARYEQDPKALATSLLVSGHPQAFCELHQLALSTEAVEAGEQGGGGGAVQPRAAQLDLLLDAQELLREADAAQQAGATLREFEARNALALRLDQAGLLAHTAREYERCLSIADFADGRIASHLALGAVAHRRGHLEDALRNFKAHAALVADSGNADTVREAQAYLLTAHSALADAAARGGNCASARAHLDACLVAATAAENGAAAAAALHQLGLLAQAQAQWQEAIDFQQRFLDAPRPAGAPDSAACAAAYLSLAECHDALGASDAALAALEVHADLTRLAPPAAQARGAYKLGAICYSAGRLDQAILHLERFFELARSMSDHAALQAARISLGEARAAATFVPFLAAVQSGSTDRLLAWKNLRVPLADN